MAIPRPTKRLPPLLAAAALVLAAGAVLRARVSRPSPSVVSAEERRTLRDAPGDDSSGVGSFDTGSMRRQLDQYRQNQAGPAAAAPQGAAPPSAPPPNVAAESCSAPLPPISATSNAANRINTRSFPSIFQAWEPASNVGSQHHDLIWSSPDYFHYACYNQDAQGRLVKQTYKGLCTAYLPYTSSDRLPKGDGVVRLAEIRWYDAVAGYFPDDSPFWKNGSPTNAAVSTIKGGSYLLNFTDPCFQKHVAQQCQAAVKAGFDGCLLDRWSDVSDAVKNPMLKQVRAAIGDALIVVNNNGRVPSDLADVNGVFAEGFGTKFFSPAGGTGGNGDEIPYPKPAAWEYLINDLKALKGAREPQANAIEGWGDAGNAQELRALTTLVLVYSNAYLLYSRSNQFQGGHDHSHVWDPFWTADLGQPVDQDPPDPAHGIPGGAVYRRFSKGIAVYNPTSAPVTVPAALLSGLHRSHRLNGAIPPGDVPVPAGDGDIFVQ